MTNRQTLAAGLAALLLLLCTACGASSSLTEPAQPDFALPDLSELPEALPRETSDEVAQTYTGAEAMDQSLNVSLQGSSAILEPGAGEIAWQIYAFASSPPPAILRAEILGQRGAGDGIWWIGLSDYAGNRWRFFEQTTDGATIQSSGLPSQFSSGTSAYIAIIVTEGNSFTLESATTVTDDEVVPGTDWYHTWGESGNENPTCIDGDSAGNVYVGGISYADTPGELGQMLILKYSSSGELIRAREWIVPDENNDDDIAGATEMYVSPTGDVYLIGNASQAVGSTYDIIVMKLNSSLDQLWCKRLASDGDDSSFFIQPSPDGLSMYISGGSEGGENLTFNPLLVSISAADGSLNEQFIFENEESSAFTYFNTGDGGEIYLTGMVFAEEGDFALLTSLDNTGTLDWSYTAGMSQVRGILSQADDTVLFISSEAESSDFGDLLSYGLITFEMTDAGTLNVAGLLELADSGLQGGLVKPRSGGGYQLVFTHFNYETSEGGYGPLLLNADYSFDSYTSVFSADSEFFSMHNSGDSFFFTSAVWNESELGPEPVDVTGFTSSDITSGLDLTAFALDKQASTLNYGDEEGGQFTDNDGTEDRTLGEDEEIYIARQDLVFE